LHEPVESLVSERQRLDDACFTGRGATIGNPADTEKSTMTDQDHKPQSGDRNLNDVADKDKPQQDKRDEAIKKGEEKMDKASKRDEGVR
jgi:hypothetical protein